MFESATVSMRNFLRFMLFFLVFRTRVDITLQRALRGNGQLIFSRYMASAYRQAAYREFTELSEVGKESQPGSLTRFRKHEARHARWNPFVHLRVLNSRRGSVRLLQPHLSAFPGSSKVPKGIGI